MNYHAEVTTTSDNRTVVTTPPRAMAYGGHQFRVNVASILARNAQLYVAAGMLTSEWGFAPASLFDAKRWGTMGPDDWTDVCARARKGGIEIATLPDGSVRTAIHWAAHVPARIAEAIHMQHVEYAAVMGKARYRWSTVLRQIERLRGEREGSSNGDHRGTGWATSIGSELYNAKGGNWGARFVARDIRIIINGSKRTRLPAGVATAEEYQRTVAHYQDRWSRVMPSCRAYLRAYLPRPEMDS